MKTRTWPGFAGCLFLALAVACGGEDSASKGDGGSGGGGSGGTGGIGGTGGVALEGCEALPLPGPIAEGHWSPQFTVAGLEGQDGWAPRVFDLALDPTGAPTAAGYFSSLGATPVPPVVHRAEGGWESARQEWEVEPTGGFTAIAYGPGGELALATLSSLPPHEVQVWVDDGDGLEVAGTFEGQIRTLAWLGDVLWVAGNMQLEGTAIAGLALWDGAGWATAPGGNPDGPIYELTLDGTGILAGGDFHHVGGVAAEKVAAWDGSAWTDHHFDLGPATIYALARGPDGRLYAGGPMFVNPDDARGGIAVETETGWQLVDDGVASGYIPGVVSDLAVFQGDLYVTGCFSHVGGASSAETAIRSRGIARWNTRGWEALDDDTAPVFSAWYNPNACGDEGPDAVWNMGFQRLLPTDDLLYVAGSFAGIAGTPSQALIAYDGETWFPQGEAGDGVNGPILEMAVGGPTCDLYALGSLTHAGGVATPGGVLAYRDGWRALGANRPANLTCEHIAVTDAGTVYVACYEFTQEGPVLPHLYVIDGDEWLPQGEPLPVEGILTDLALDDQGRPVISGGGERGWVVRLEGGGFQVIASDFDALVYRISIAPKGAPDAGSIVAGGYFTKVGDVEANRIARFDGTAWTALGAGLHAMPMALEYGVTGIYAATGFEGDPARELLARWDGSAWTELATPENGLAAPLDESVHTFTALLERDGKLLATGYVWPETGGRNAFLWDGTRFTAIGGGLPAISVDGVALAADGLWFGGWIALAGDDPGVPSVGVARMTW